MRGGASVIWLFCLWVEFYGYLVYKLMKIVGSNIFSAQFIKINSFYSFIFKLCIVIVHTLNMCTSYFVNI